MQEYVLKIKHPKAYYGFYRFLQFILQIFFRIIYRVEEKGREKIPREGGLILCSNHLSYIDPIIIDVFFPRCVFFMAKAEVFENSFLASLSKFFNAFPVNRNTFDRKTLRNSLDIINGGEVVGVFPQGTRYPDGAIGEGKKGVGMISVMGNCPITPMVLSGTNKIVQKPRKRIFFPKVRINYGDAIDVKQVKEEYSSKEAIEIIVDRTMSSLRDLYKEIDK
jgi:1-acyl-sn-glycerol-3-phosphate acyltransferase